MTLNDIKNEMAALAYDPEIKLNSSVIFAIQRALCSIYSERGIQRTAPIIQNRPSPLVHVPLIKYAPGDDVFYTLSDGAYSFTASGIGSFVITDADGERELSFNAEAKDVCGFINGDGKITFKGDFCYTVTDFCLFDAKISNTPSDLIFRKMYTYNLKEIFSDFLGIADEVRDKDGKPIAGARIWCDILTLPSDFCGKATLSYRASAPKVYEECADDPIDIDPEIAHLVPMLAASYILLEDDAELAQHYRALYREGMSALKLYNPRSVDTGYSDTTGWA